MSKRLKAVFTVSLLLNVLLMGALVGQGVHHYKKSDWHRDVEELSPESRQILKDAFAQRKDRIVKVKQEVLDYMRQFEEIGQADPFDEAAYNAFVLRFADFQKGVAERRLELYAEVAPKLTLEEREKFTKMISRKVIGGHFYRKDRRGDKGDARMKHMPPPPPGHHGDNPPPTPKEHSGEPADL